MIYTAKRTYNMKIILSTFAFLICTGLYGVDLGAYNSLIEAKNTLPVTINSGDTFSTLGYWTENDGGSALYTIQIDNGITFDNGSKIELPNHSGFYAKLSVPTVDGFNEINVRQYGVRGVSSIASLYDDNDYYDLETFPDISNLNRPNSVSIDNIIRLMELSVFIKDDPFLSAEKVRIIFSRSPTDNVIPIANTWYISRGELELEIEGEVTVYGDVTGYFEDAGYGGCLTGYSTRVASNHTLSTHNGSTIVIAQYGTKVNEFLARYVDIYVTHNDGSWHNICRDHDSENSNWIENIRIFGGGTISNFGRIIKEAVIDDDTYKNGGNENGIGLHKVKNITIENITLEDVGRKAITTQPGGGEITIKDVTITNPGYYGINLEDNRDIENLITELKIETTTVDKVRLANAINIKPLPTSVIIANNKISNVINSLSGNAHGIFCKANESVTITNNELNNCVGTAIVFGGKQIKVESNVIRNCHAGISFYGLEKSYGVNDNIGSISNNQFEGIENLDITEYVPDPNYANIDPDWDNIVIQNNKAIDDILNLNEYCKEADISNNSPYVSFGVESLSDDFLVMEGDLVVRSSSNTHALFVGNYRGIQGIQVERENGDNIRLVANYENYGTGLESSSSLKFSVDGKDLEAGTAMEISRDGNVGIGKAPSGYKLDVNGSVHTNDGYYLNGYNNILDLNKSNSRSDKKNTINVSDRLEGLDCEIVNRSVEKGRNNKSIEYHIPVSQLKEQFPSLVKQDSNHNDNFVNYVGLIPILVQALNDHTNTIDSLKAEINSLKSMVPDNYSNISSAKTSGILFDNVPNPFSTSTEISAYIANTVNSASIYIYELNGTQVRSYNIVNRNNISITVDGSTLKSGMYLYSLVLDNVLIDTKQMIITQ